MLPNSSRHSFICTYPTLLFMLSRGHSGSDTGLMGLTCYPEHHSLGLSKTDGSPVDARRCQHSHAINLQTDCHRHCPWPMGVGSAHFRFGIPYPFKLALWPIGYRSSSSDLGLSVPVAPRKLIDRLGHSQAKQKQATCLFAGALHTHGDIKLLFKGGTP